MPTPMFHIVRGCRPQCSCYFPAERSAVWSATPERKKCHEPAAFWMYAPDGEPVPGGVMCRAHGTVIHDEYLEKLGEDWPLVPLEVAS